LVEAFILKVQTARDSALWQSVQDWKAKISAGPSHWIWNGTVGSLNSLVGGVSEPLRFGSTAGALSGQGHVTVKEVAIGTLQEATRAVSLVPVGAAIGKGTGALVSTLSKDAEGEALSGVLGGCFPSGTLVATKNGFAEIQNVRVGDLVWSYSLQAEEWQLRPVEATPVRDYAGDVVTISLAGAVIDATGNHPIWVVSGEDLGNRPLVKDLPEDQQISSPLGRWVEARSLKIGDELLLLDGGTANINSLATRQDHFLVYNLHVASNHTYAVSQAGVLVHNKAAQIKPIPRETDSEVLSRLGTFRESAARLARKAAEAEEQIGIHGVSTTAGKPIGAASQAAREDVESTFPVHDTPTRNDPLHRTVELPKPVTPQTADQFNKKFGRD
jgi:hypothetical protein